MKKNVHLPELPSDIDENHRRFYTEVLEELETLRRESVEAIAENLIKKVDDDAGYEDSFLNQAKAFVECLQIGKKPLSTLDDVRNTLNIIYSAYKSNDENMVIEL